MRGAVSWAELSWAAAREEKVWLTAMRSSPLSPPSLLEREEVKCTPSNKHTRMPMQNTLPSLLATVIFLKLMSSRAPEASLRLELERPKWADNRGRKMHQCEEDQEVCSPMNTFNAPDTKCYFLVCFEKREKYCVRTPPTCAQVPVTLCYTLKQKTTRCCCRTFPLLWVCRV